MIDYAIIRERLEKARKAVEGRKFVLAPILGVNEYRTILDALNDEALLIDRCQKSDEYSKAGPSPAATKAPERPSVLEEVLALKFQSLKVAPGDVVVLSSPNILSKEAIANVSKSFKNACGVPGIRAFVLEEGLKVDDVLHQVEKRTAPEAKIPAFMGLFNLFLRLQIVSAAFENGRILLKSTIRHPDETQIGVIVKAVNDAFPDVSMTMDWCGHATTWFLADHDTMRVHPLMIYTENGRQFPCGFNGRTCHFSCNQY